MLNLKIRLILAIQILLCFTIYSESHIVKNDRSYAIHDLLFDNESDALTRRNYLIDILSKHAFVYKIVKRNIAKYLVCIGPHDTYEESELLYEKLLKSGVLSDESYPTAISNPYVYINGSGLTVRELLYGLFPDEMKGEDEDAAGGYESQADSFYNFDSIPKKIRNNGVFLKHKLHLNDSLGSYENGIFRFISYTFTSNIDNEEGDELVLVLFEYPAGIMTSPYLLEMNRYDNRPQGHFEQYIVIIKATDYGKYEVIVKKPLLNQNYENMSWYRPSKIYEVKDNLDSTLLLSEYNFSFEGLTKKGDPIEEKIYQFDNTTKQLVEVLNGQ